MARRGFLTFNVKILAALLAIVLFLFMSGLAGVLIYNQMGGYEKKRTLANASLIEFREKITWGCHPDASAPKGSIDFSFPAVIGEVNESGDQGNGGSYLMAGVCGAGVVRVPITGANGCTEVQICKGGRGLSGDGAGENCNNWGVGGSVYHGKIYVGTGPGSPGPSFCVPPSEKSHEFNLHYNGDTVIVDEIL